ncbi:MAG: alkaline phosphatase family protein [Thermoplasmata archaeon]
MGVPVPAYDGACIANLFPTVFRSLDRPAGPGPALAPGLRRDLDPWSEHPIDGPVVVFLVDGFGWCAEQEWLTRSADPASKAWASHSRPITTVFPTTTTAALTALCTGTPPARNGVVGYRQFLPRFGLMADLLKMSPLGIPAPGTLVGPEWSAELISSASPVFARGLRGTVITREAFEGSGLSRVLYGGAEFVGYATASELAHHLIEVLGRPTPPEVVFAYWDELDTVHHRRGPTATLFDFEAERLTHLVAHVARQLPKARARSTTLLVTGDHGQVPSAREHQVRIDQIPDIAREMAYPLGGDRRCGYFGARPGRVEALRRALVRHLPSGARILSMDDVLDAGLFGPPPYHPEVHERLGDLLAIMPVPYGLTYMLPGASTPRRHLLGSHGGLEPAELLVPLVSGPLSDFEPPA